MTILNRIVSSTGVVIKGTLFMAKDEEPLTEEEYQKVDLVHRLTLSFISRNRLQKTVYRMAFFDLDGYANLRVFMRHIGEKYHKNELVGNTAACINLRQFSLINQDLGRQLGDYILRKYFDMIQAELGDDGIICRMGGDNFVLFFKNEKKEKMLEMFESLPVCYDEENEKRVVVSARAGIFTIPPDFKIDNPGQIMEMVYPAVQMAKGVGQSVIVYDKNMLANREKIKKLRQQFAIGMKTGEFHSYYQPKVDVRTGQIVGAESLCRWIKKDGRMVMPMEFIPVLEMNMDICTLDFHMLEVVCRDIRKWIDEGKTIPRISVNFSRKHLMNPDLVDNILSIIDKYEVPHSYIEIELTETTTDVEFTDLKRIVTNLQAEGVYTSVDDFGNGFSSLNLIRSIPWNVLKIDRSLLPMDDEHADSITSCLYNHVVSMVRDIGIECITEGVETRKQVDLLRTNDCNIAQGFYFDKALPIEEFEAKMEGCPYQSQLA